MSPSARSPDLLDAIDGVDGWLSNDQAQRLYEAARRHAPWRPDRRDRQLPGSQHHRAGRAAPDGVTVIAIDPHAGNDRGPQEISGFEAEAAGDHEVFTANLAAAGLPTGCNMSASSAIERSRRLGAHRRAVHRRRASLRAGRVRHPLVGEPSRAGGTMLIHDSFSSVGVTLAIVRELMFGRRFRYVGRSRRSASTVPISTASGDRARSTRCARLHNFRGS